MAQCHLARSASTSAASMPSSEHLARGERRPSAASRTILIEAKQRVLANMLAERVHRAGAPARPHRRRPLSHARLRGRAAAGGARSCSSCISRSTAPTSPPPATAWRIARSSTRRIGKARAAWFGPDAGDLRLPARCSDPRPGGARAAPSQRRARAPLRLQGAAVHRPDDGEIARGHRLLSLSPAAGAERGRRRSGMPARCRSRTFMIA